MAKRRTKKQKQKARRNLTISWEPQKSKARLGSKNKSPEAAVKRQLPNEPGRPKSDVKASKKARYSEKDGDMRTIKQDIIKSLVLAGIIIGSEIVLYLFLRS